MKIGSKFFKENIVILFKSYSAIFFIDNIYAGFAFFVITFIYPNIAISGLIALASGFFVSKFLKFPDHDIHLRLYNSLLLGLSIGAIYKISFPVLIVIVIGSIIAIMLTVVLYDIFWVNHNLPLLSVPFVLAALITNFAAMSYSSLEHYLGIFGNHESYFSQSIDNFLIALSSGFFVPHQMSGLIILIIIFIISRYLFILSIFGYIVGDAIFDFLSGVENNQIMIWSGFNMIFSAMAVGGIFTVPSWQGFAVAMLSSMIAAFFVVAIENFMLVYGLSVIAIPFLLTAYIVLSSLKKRNLFSKPELNLTNPTLPEAILESQNSFKLRFNGNLTNIAVPFYGTWNVYQAFSGRYTHQSKWKYAIDFILLENGKSYKSQGLELKDYYAYEKPICSPVYGVIHAIENEVVDNIPGRANVKENWGNYILIYISSGLYIMLAHLQRGSINVGVGQGVVPSQMVARCGNSGRSFQPHLHIHLQELPYLGSATVPFAFYNVLKKLKNCRI